MNDLEPMSDEEVNEIVKRKTLEVFVCYDRAWCTKKQMKITEHAFYHFSCYKWRKGSPYCKYFEKINNVSGR